MLTHIDLFSGIGGFALAARWAGVETIAFAEIDSYASRVLQRHWPRVTNYGDVRNVPTLDAWLVTGGVPCQPASVAGKRRGAEDDRWLWPEALAAVERIRSAWVLFENPTGILSLNDGVEFERVCAALEGQGYEVQPLVIPACGVGANHRRERIWIVAHPIREQLRAVRYSQTLGTTGAVESGEKERQRVRIDIRERRKSGEAADDDEREWWPYTGEEWRRNQDVADPSEQGLPERNGQRDQPARQRDAEFECGGWWAVEPNVGRVANGIPKRVDRLRGLGNAIVPQVAYQLIKRMIEAEAQNNLSSKTEYVESQESFAGLTG